jgi:hypothetical protein
LEQIKIDVVLNGVGYDDRWPHVIINVNEDTHFEGILKGEQAINFKVDIEDNSSNCLDIIFDNHHMSDTVIDDVGAVIKGKWIIIENIKFEGIDLEWYYKQDREKWPLKRRFETELSWNSKYTINFDSPLYIWLLENL